MSKRRVVVTGLGIVSPVGHDVDTAWKSVLAGKSGIAPITRFDTTNFPIHFGGEIRDLNLEPYITAKEARRMDAFMQYGVVAGMQAMRDSGLVVTEENSERIGVMMGAGMGGLESIEGTYDKYLETKSPKKVSPFFIPASIINLVSGHLSIEFKVTGPNLAVATACTTSTHAIGLATRLIQWGEADAMIAGGSEMATCYTGVSGFAQAKALSLRNDDPQGASRPWDKDRDGFVMGDGAGAMLLEEYEHAKARGARIYAEVIGFGMSGDAFHVTAPPADGEGARKAMSNALKDAQLSPDKVQYVNAHATSTELGDRAETTAIRRAFGSAADTLAVSSTKSMTGHLLGAAGAVEAIFSILALRDQVAPPTINLHQPGEGCDLDYVPNTARPMALQNVLSNSFGFGGNQRFRSFSAEFDPLWLISRYPDCYPGILESGARAHLGGGPTHRTVSDDSRYDILPIANGEFLSLDSNALLGGTVTPAAGGFLAALEQWMTALPPPSSGAHELPFRGGWLVYLGYEIAAEVEPRLQLPRNADRYTALALRAPAAWVRDRRTGQGWLIAEPGHEDLLDRFCRHVSTALAPSLPMPGRFQLTEEEPSRFEVCVRRALEYIAAGDIYQANLSRGWHACDSQPIDPVAVYRRLRATNPGPFSALIRYADFAVMSSSPERLVASDGRRVSSRPIAGTRPRGATAEADAALIRQLLDNEKERAEHVMLIDLERNDLGRVCVGGSVHVDEFMSVESYAHVHHIVSNVSGILRADTSSVDVLRAVFPGGTITGCPKFRCMQIIAELEEQGRGAYTGSLGYINRDGSLDFNILIRTMSLNGNELNFRAGAGIVADSVPDRELAETRAKAEGLLRALNS